MSRKSRRRRHKKNKFMSSVLYYVLVIALVAGLLFVVKVNHQERAERTEYKEKLAGKETEEDIGVHDGTTYSRTYGNAGRYSSR